jgi:Fimbrial assembly protein (PilN)
MMVLNLNFLPKEKFNDIKTMMSLGWINNVLRCGAVLLVIFAAFLTLIYFVLTEQADMLARRSHEISQSYTYYNQEVGVINKNIDMVSTAGRDFGLLTPRFWAIADSLPGDIQLKSIALTIENANTMAISGVAKSRDALIYYEKELQKLPWVTKTVLPTSQLLQKTDINFVIEISTTPPSPEEYFTPL